MVDRARVAQDPSMTYRTGLLALLLTGCFTSPVGNGDDAGGGDASNQQDSSANDAGPDVADLPDVVTQGDETWNDGKQLTASVLIPQGVTVTIAPGATVTASSGVLVWVKGTLKVASASGTHAKITGTGWTGIKVTDTGTLALDGLDVQNAGTALDVEQQTSASYTNGTIDHASTPFLVGAAGVLSVGHAKVTAPAGITRIDGAFTASYLDYDSNDHGALFVENAVAVVAIDDSTIHNSGPMGSTSAPDQITSNAATKVHVAYTDISGAHCGFHFEGVDAVEVDHVTVQNVTNGADVWGSSNVGTRTITSSNFESLTKNFDENGSNGVFSVTGCYLAGQNHLIDGQIQISGSATSAIVDAHPH
jgi:hypothetical protein